MVQNKWGKCLKTQKNFKEAFEKINYKEETRKGVDVNNKPGKRGYDIISKYNISRYPHHDYKKRV